MQRTRRRVIRRTTPAIIINCAFADKTEHVTEKGFVSRFLTGSFALSLLLLLYYHHGLKWAINQNFIQKFMILCMCYNVFVKSAYPMRLRNLNSIRKWLCSDIYYVYAGMDLRKKTAGYWKGKMCSCLLLCVSTEWSGHNPFLSDDFKNADHSWVTRASSHENQSVMRIRVSWASSHENKSLMSFISLE